MAPDLSGKRWSLGRAISTHRVRQGMLLLQHRRTAAGYPLGGYPHLGSSGGLSSSGTGATTRPAVAPTAKAYHSSRRINHPRQTGQPKILLGSSRQNAAGVRSSDELAARLISAQDVCDNSNDSGLGFEERQQQQQLSNNGWNAGEEDSKRRRMDIKLESEDANFAFPEAQTRGGSEAKNAARGSTNGIGSAPISRTGSGGVVGRVVGVTRPRQAIGVLGSKRSSLAQQGPITLTSQLCHVSRDGKTQLQIICQPEQQHRARYQTEGSRGAVKDRTGNGFPIVRLVGYEKPATLQVFIGTDLGRVAPHMFYQACRVSGKNSTPCVERKVDGTIVIEVDMDPTKEMLVTCDCVGILKERNVDVEHRFPQEASILQGRSKKKSTRCRMVFRTNISHVDGTTETLQVCSQPIVCTQPPGIPEISKKSLTSCPCTGGLELFVLGKNFLKDTRMVFQLDNEDLSTSLESHWECAVLPDKEFLQQTHLVCVVPPYRRQDLEPAESVTVKLFAVSSGKTSEPHTFMYTAASAAPEPSVGKIESTTSSLTTSSTDTNMNSSTTAPPSITSVSPSSQLSQAVAVGSNFVTAMQQQQCETLKSESCQSPSAPGPAVTPVMMWASQAQNCQNSCEDVMMPPPPLVVNPIITRRSSSNLQLILPDNLKTEVIDENSQSSMISENSMQGLSSAATNNQLNTSPLQMVDENSREATPSLLGTVNVSSNVSPAQEAAANLLGVTDMICHQHSLAMAPQDPFGTMQESPQVKVLSPRHINKDSCGHMSSGGESSPNESVQGAGVVDLCMKQHQHQSDFSTLTTFATTAPGQSLPTQSGHSIEKYLNHIESTVSPVKAAEGDGGMGNSFVTSIQQTGSIVSPGHQQQQQSQQPPHILAPTQATVKLDALVNSAAETHQIGSSLQNSETSPGSLIGHVSPVAEAIHRSSPSQTTRTSPPIPVKTMILEALMPSPTMTGQPMNPVNVTVSSNSVVMDRSPAEHEALMSSPTMTGQPMNSVNVTVSSNSVLMDRLTTIAAALLPPMQGPPIVTAAGTAASPTCVTSVHHPLQVSGEPMEQLDQMQVMAQQDAAAAMQQVQQVEQVMAEAQQQVEQVVAQAQQQAVQAVQQAQQQVVQQVVQHAQVVQQAVKQVQAVQQVQAVPAVQQAFQQATQEVVQQAVQQATHEVVQQVQAVQQAVQQAQAAQAMQHAVQQDIESMLSQPAGFVAEASSALASGAAQEPSQQRLTTAAEQAINSVITNATQDIINNRPITTTTAHAIIATKNILNSVATQSAQLMNTAMEGILPKSPSGQGNLVEQVANKTTPPVNNGQVVNVPVSVSGGTNPNNGPVRKPEDAVGMLPQELTSMSEHDLLSYINPSCFDPQGGFLM